MTGTSGDTQIQAVLVRIVVKLAADVERFDSVLLEHRQLLDQTVTPLKDPWNDAGRRSEFMSAQAGEMVVSARQALDKLRHLGRVGA